jgi:Zn-dependent protease with chaperone function
MALIARLAVEAKVPPPARVSIIAGDKVQAMVGGGDEKNPGYELRYTKALEALPPEAQEAIMRHEYAHRRHHDGVWSAVTMFLTTMPAMIALLGAAEKPDAIGWLAGAIALTSLLMFPVSLQHSEYLADQYAASKPEGAGPLARFFVEDSPNPARAASALSGREFSAESGWKRRAIMFWDSLKTLFSAHPSHDRRIARLARLAAKPAAERRR